jgi:hypothetical protein
LISASSTMKVVATAQVGRVMNALRYVWPNATAAEEALVMPELITVKATMKVRNGIPNARLVYSAAPAARGYLPTSSK